MPEPPLSGSGLDAAARQAGKALLHFPVHAPVQRYSSARLRPDRPSARIVGPCAASQRAAVPPRNFPVWLLAPCFLLLFEIIGQEWVAFSVAAVPFIKACLSADYVDSRSLGFLNILGSYFHRL